MAGSWRYLACNIQELRLDITLACGQSFRWRELSSGEWTSVLCGRLWTLKQNDEYIMYKVIEPELQPMDTTTTNSKTPKDVLKSKNNIIDISVIKKESEDTVLKIDGCTNSDVYESILKDYFRLNYNLSDLYERWGRADENFRRAASTFTGVRMLRQDPVENLFSFICSSNNHISRIGGMVERMCEAYGKKICEVDGQSYHSFPSVQRLAEEGVQLRLRELGFGYRAKFINESAKMIQDRGDNWLYTLRGRPYEETKAELMTLLGVGAKVADCVCLMSMDQLGAIPVDTHVWQIAVRDYMPKLNSAKSLTPTIYKQIGDHFRTLWGEMAGWAHSVLFAADLKKFQDLKRKTTTSEKKPIKREKADVKPTKLEVHSPDKRSEAAVKVKRPKRSKQI